MTTKTRQPMGAGTLILCIIIALIAAPFVVPLVCATCAVGTIGVGVMTSNDTGPYEDHSSFVTSAPSMSKPEVISTEINEPEPEPEPDSISSVGTKIIIWGVPEITEDCRKKGDRVAIFAHENWKIWAKFKKADFNDVRSSYVNNWSVVFYGTVQKVVDTDIYVGSCRITDNGIPDSAEHVGPYVATPEELIKRFDDNEVKANKLFDNFSFCVQGQVDNIGLDIIGQPYLTMRPDEGLRSIQMVFNDDNQLEDLVKGQWVMVKGTCRGMMMNIIFENCEIINTGWRARKHCSLYIDNEAN